MMAYDAATGQVKRSTQLDGLVMNRMSQGLNGFDIAAAAAKRLQWELHKRRLLNPEFNPEEIWAAITYDGRIRVGTPVLHSGQGFYLNHSGEQIEV